MVCRVWEIHNKFPIEYLILFNVLIIIRNLNIINILINQLKDFCFSFSKHDGKEGGDLVQKVQSILDVSLGRDFMYGHQYLD